MPDTNPRQEPSTTTRSSNKATLNVSSAPEHPSAVSVKRRLHLVLQGKGGVGKTFVASLLAQYHQSIDRSVICYDTDPVNSSLSAIPALAARPVALIDGELINSHEMDRLVDEWIAAEADIIVDNGAASFVPLSRYLIENEISTVLAAYGVEMVLHTVIAGGGSMLDTVRGLDSLLRDDPPAVRVVVWANEYFGPTACNGIEFEDSKICRDNSGRVAGVVRLGKMNPHQTRNVIEMLDRKLTFAEAIASPATMVVGRQRLTMVRRDIFHQLAAVV